jgi:phage shock protein PspC (stress-responsive transcriptional regulator)
MTETLGQTDTQTQSHTPYTPSNSWSGKRLFRSRENRMVAGVSGGLGDYLGVDPTIVRLGFVVSAFFGGAGIIAYLVAWLIVPEA